MSFLGMLALASAVGNNYYAAMKIIDSFKHMDPHEREIMFLRAAKGSAIIEGAAKSAVDECDRLIQKHRRALLKKSGSQRISGESKVSSSE